MANGPITKIYQLKTTGYSDLHTQLNQVAKDFEAIKKAKIEVDKASANATSTQQQKEYINQLRQIKLDMAELSKQTKQLEADMKAQQLQRQAQIQQIKDQTALGKALAAQQQQNAKQTAAAVQAEAGSYAATVQQLKELYALTKSVSANSGTAINFNGQALSYEQAIEQIKRLSATEQEFRRQFAADKTLVGEYTTGIVQAFKNMGLGDVIGGQVAKANEKITSLASELNVLKESLLQIRSGGQSGLDAIVNKLGTMQVNGQELTSEFITLNKILQESGGNGARAYQLLEEKLIQDTNEVRTLREEVNRVNGELHSTGTVGTQITTGFANGFKEMGNQVKFFLLSYVGVMAVFNGIVAAVHANEELSDSLVNLQIYIKGTKNDVDDLFESLKKIETRTTLSGLVDIANTVAQKGVAKEQIAGVTQAFDEYFTVMSNAGKSEDVHEGVFTIAKLISIFNDDHEVTATRVKELGNAIFSLRTSGPVSNEFLQGFAERVGAVRSITGATIPQILGMGAAFQQMGQSEEVAGSATSILLSKMIANQEKFAQVAGISTDIFKKIIQDNPFEALLRVAESLKGKGADAFEDAIKNMGDLGINAVRARGAFAELINNADLFRQKMAQSADAIGNVSGLQDAFAQKQETLAGTMDKIGKAFLTAFSNPNIIEGLNDIAKSLLFFIKVIANIPFAAIITGITLLTAGWAFLRGNVIASTVAQAANNETSLLGSIRMFAQRLAINATTEARIAEIAATEGEVAAQEALNAATAASPLGLILAAIAVLIPVVTAFGAKLEDTTGKIEEQNTALTKYANIEGQIQLSMREQTAKTKNVVGELINIIKTEVDNLDLRKRAYQNLISISPEFIGTLDEQFKATDKLNGAYEDFIANLDKVARAQAIKNVKQKIEDDRAAAEAEVFQAKIAKDQEDANNRLIEQQNKQKALTGLSSSDLGASGTAFRSIQELQDEKAKQYRAALAKAKNAEEQSKAFDKFMETANQDDKRALVSALTDNKTSTVPGGEQTIDTLKAKLADIDNQIKAMDALGSKDKIQIAKLQDLRKQRAEIVKEIKELGGDLSTTDKSARLSSSEVDDLNGLQAQRDREIADLELHYAEIKKYRDLDVSEQVTYLQQLQEINNRYDTLKINSIRGSNEKELAERAQLNLKIIDNDIATNEKIKAIYTKAFEEKSALLKKQLETGVTKINLEVDVVQNDTDASNEDKAKAVQDANQQLLSLYNSYYANVLTLAQLYGQKTNVIEEEMQKQYTEIARKGLDDAQNVIKGKLQDIEDSYSDAEASITDKFDNLRSAILNDSGRSQLNKDLALSEIDQVEKVAQATEKLKIAQQAFNDVVLQPVRVDGTGAVSNDVAKQLHHNVVVAQQELDNAIKVIYPKAEKLQDLFTNKLAAIFNFNINTDKGKAKYELLAQTIQATFDTASNAMNSYFDAERNRIQASLNLQLKRLDIEETQQKARAQSQAEQNAIDSEFQAKKDALNKAAFEKEKKQQIAQAEINLGLQLSNLAVVAFSPANILNLTTGGLWGAIFYGVQAALAIANFAFNVEKIKSSSYEFGGNPDRQTTRGGRVRGRSHASGGNPFLFKGRMFEDEVDELNVIRTKDVDRNQRFAIAGTQSQIASALNVAGGGIPFDAGATMKRFDFGGGVSLQKYSVAPVFTAASSTTTINNNSITRDDLQAMYDGMVTLAEEQSRRIDRIEVHQVTRSVTDAQSKAVKQKQIGTI